MHCIALKSMGEQTRNHLSHYLESISSKHNNTRHSVTNKTQSVLYIFPLINWMQDIDLQTQCHINVTRSVYRSTHSEPSLEWVVGYKYKTKRQQNPMSNRSTSFRRWKHQEFMNDEWRYQQTRKRGKNRHRKGSNIECEPYHPENGSWGGIVCRIKDAEQQIPCWTASGIFSYQKGNWFGG